MRPDVRHRVNLALRFSRARARIPLSRVFSSALVRLGVSRPPRSRALVWAHRPLPRSPSFDVTSLEGFGSLGLCASRRPGRPARTVTLSDIHPLGSGMVSDPGHHRPMSAIHDLLFSRWAPFVRYTSLRVSHTSRWLAVHAATASLGVIRPHHVEIVPPRSDTFVPSMLRHPRIPRRNARSGCEQPSRLVRPPASPASPAHRSAHEIGASPRWSRPANPRRMNGTGSVVGPKHHQLSSRSFVPYVWGSPGARGLRS